MFIIFDSLAISDSSTASSSLGLCIKYKPTISTLSICFTDSLFLSRV